MKQKPTSRYIALGGILAAITVISVYFAVILPTNKLAIFSLSSFMVSIILIEMGIKSAWGFYIATTFLSFLVVPDKLMVIPFATFFGVYGIVKYYAEKINNIIIEFIIKIIYFNINVVLAYYLIKALFESQKLFQMLPMWAIILVLQIAFIIYDYAYTLFIRYYCDKLKKMIRI